MKRNVLAAAAAAATAVLALTGCGGAAGPAEEGAAEGQTPLTVSVWNYEGTPEFKALFDAYEEANPDIDIQHVDILADDYAEKVTTMLAGGDTTDVLTMKNVTDYSRYANRGQLLEINDVVESLDTENTASLDAFDLDGSYFAAPYRQDFWLLYYNKDLFDAAGVEYPERMTWDEYTETAKQLTSGGEGDKVYGTYHHYWRSVVQAISAAQNDGDLIGGEYDFFQDQYDTVLELQEEGAALDWATAMSQQTGYQSIFETGQTAMLPMGSWYIAALVAAQEAGEADFNWGLAPMPQVSEGEDVSTFGSPTAFAVNKNAEHSQEAKDFIAWAAGEGGAAAIAEIGVVPALQTDSVTEAYFQLEGLPTDDVSKAAFTPDETALEMPVSEYSSDVDLILQEEHELIMVGEKTVEQGIADMNSRVQSEVLN